MAKAMASAINGLQGTLNTTIDIPVISWLYKYVITGTPTDPRGFQAALESALATWCATEAGPCTESWGEFLGRTGAVLDGLVGELGKGDNALVFTSGGVIGALAARALVGASGACDAAHAIAKGFLALNRVTCNAGITKLVTGRAGTTLVSFNEHAHFEAGAAGVGDPDGTLRASTARPKLTYR
jgi:hypothetical protein